MCADSPDQRFSALGKSSKHEADAVFKSNVAGLHELREALIVATDSALCFILAFVLQDRSRALEGKSPPMEMWRTFIPLAVFLSEKAKTLNAPSFQGFWYYTPPRGVGISPAVLMCGEKIVNRLKLSFDSTSSIWT